MWTDLMASKLCRQAVAVAVAVVASAAVVT